MNASELLELAKKEINWGHGKCSKEYHTAIAPDKIIPLLERYLELEQKEKEARAIIGCTKALLEFRKVEYEYQLCLRAENFLKIPRTK